jgi:hypothetical protein
VPAGGGICGCIGAFFDAATWIRPGRSITASPQITETLFFFIRNPTPPLRRFETSRDR